VADANNAGGTTPAADAGAGNPFKAVKFVIEMVTDQNNMTACAVTKRLLRGRFDPQNLKNRVADDRFATCPVIPGILMVFDGAARTVEYRDPLFGDEGTQTRKEIQAAVAAMGWGRQDAEKPKVYRNLPDDKLKAFAYWARRWVDSRQAERKDGQVPPMAAIEKLPGRVERNVFDTSSRREKFPADVPQYMTPAEAAGAVG